MKRYLYITFAVVWVLIGCTHKELCYHHPHQKDVTVVFDWSGAPNVTPRSMCVYFYAEDGSSWQRFDFNGHLGGTAKLHVGRYHAIFYNNDTTGLLFSDTDSFEKHTLYTREGDVLEPIYGNTARHTPRARNTEDQMVTICPDMVYGGYAVDIEVTDFGVKYSYVSSRNNVLVTVDSPDIVLTLYPVQQTARYTYEITNVKNLKYASSMCASLSGMAYSLAIGEGELSPTNVIIPFAAKPELANNRITGEFITFGHHPANDEKHMFVLYVIFDNGEKYYYTFDVTDQVDEAEDSLHIHLEINDLSFPTPIYNGNGFQVGVDDWERVEQDLIL